jgi:hypothetical protein
MQTLAKPKLVFNVLKPTTVIGKHVGEVPSSGISPPVPKNVCACTKPAHKIKQMEARRRFLNIIVLI